MHDFAVKYSSVCSKAVMSPGRCRTVAYAPLLKGSKVNTKMFHVSTSRFRNQAHIVGYGVTATPGLGPRLLGHTTNLR